MKLSTVGLSVGFTDVPVLTNITFDVAGGEMLVIFGPSGSGKTSLSLTLAGLRAPLSGEVVSPGVAALPAFPERYFVGETVEAELAAGARHPDPGRLLEKLGLSEPGFGSRSPWSLSTGEQRRVAIASACARDAPFMVWDEPTASLDPTQRQIVRRLSRQVLDAEVGLIVLGHDWEWARSDRARLMVVYNMSLREINLESEADRTLIKRMGYRLPAAWEYFATQVPSFWKKRRWLDDIAVLANDCELPSR